MCGTLFITFFIYIISLIVVSAIGAAVGWAGFSLTDSLVENGERNEALLWLRGFFAAAFIFTHRGVKTAAKVGENRWRGRTVLGSLFVLTTLLDCWLLGSGLYLIWGLLSLTLLAVPDSVIDEVIKS